jgi:hypothetical protein
MPLVADAKPIVHFLRLLSSSPGHPPSDAARAAAACFATLGFTTTAAPRRQALIAAVLQQLVTTASSGEMVLLTLPSVARNESIFPLVIDVLRGAARSRDPAAVSAAFLALATPNAFTIEHEAATTIVSVVSSLLAAGCHADARSGSVALHKSLVFNSVLLLAKLTNEGTISPAEAAKVPVSALVAAVSSAHTAPDVAWQALSLLTFLVRAAIGNGNVFKPSDVVIISTQGPFRNNQAATAILVEGPDRLREAGLGLVRACSDYFAALPAAKPPPPSETSRSASSVELHAAATRPLRPVSASTGAARLVPASSVALSSTRPPPASHIPAPVVAAVPPRLPTASALPLSSGAHTISAVASGWEEESSDILDAPVPAAAPSKLLPTAARPTIAYSGVGRPSETVVRRSPATPTGLNLDVAGTTAVRVSAVRPSLVAQRPRPTGSRPQRVLPSL